MKKNIWLIFIMTVLFAFVGCGKKEKAGGEKLKVGVAISQFDSYNFV